MRLLKDSIDEVVDFPISLKCPHCNVISGLSVISPPNYALLQRFHPNKVGIGYRCNSCEEPVFLKFEIISYGTIHGIIVLSDKYQIVESLKKILSLHIFPNQSDKTLKKL